ncbi:MAG: PIN domain-containing protein [Cyclobacteriaceae bacterium]
MNNLFLDTNVVLDLLGERLPFYKHAAQIATLSDQSEIKITVSALSYPTVFFILSKYEKKGLVKDKMKKFKVLAQTADLSDQIIEKALLSPFQDFEDALQYHCALKVNCNILITLNEKGFKHASLPALTPAEYLHSRR